MNRPGEKTVEELADAYLVAEQAYAADRGGDDDAPPPLYQAWADLLEQVIRAPAMTLDGILVKVRAAVMLEGNLGFEATPEDAFADATWAGDYSRFSDRVAIQTLWADVVRLKTEIEAPKE